MHEKLYRSALEVLEVCATGRIKVSRSTSNPGRLRLEIPSVKALQKFRTLFPDLVSSVDVLRDIEQYGKVIESLGYEALRGGETGEDRDRWDVQIWWETKRHGYSIAVVVFGEVGPAAKKFKLNLWIGSMDIFGCSSQQYLDRNANWKETRLVTWNSLRKLDARRVIIAALTKYFNQL